jgi:hypothetical protein
MLNYYKLKYHQDDAFHVRKSLAYFGDVDDQSWKNIRMVKNRLSAATVKATLIKEVNNLSSKNTIHLTGSEIIPKHGSGLERKKQGRHDGHGR